MEITFEEAQDLLKKRLEEYPQMNAIATSGEFTATLKKILELENVSPELLPLIQNEIHIVLALYTPLSSLTENIRIATDLPETTSQNIVNLIEILILNPVRNDLIAYEEFWKEQVLKENSVSNTMVDKRPETQTPENTFIEETRSVSHATMPDSPQNRPPFVKKPLTREEVMSVLTPSRTMKSDTEALTAPHSPSTSTQSEQK